MMGRQKRDQGKLFYEFHLDDCIPKNHLLRRIDVFVTAALADLHQELEPYYSDIGRRLPHLLLAPFDFRCQTISQPTTSDEQQMESRFSHEARQFAQIRRS